MHSNHNSQQIITINHERLGDIETSKKMQDEMILAAEEFYQSLGKKNGLFILTFVFVSTLPFFYVYHDFLHALRFYLSFVKYPSIIIHQFSHLCSSLYIFTYYRISLSRDQHRVWRTEQRCH